MMWRRRKKRRKTCFDRLPLVLYLQLPPVRVSIPPGPNRRGAGDFKGGRCFTKTRHHFIIFLLYQMDLQTRGLSQKFFEQHGGRALAFMVAAQLIFTVSHLFTTIDSVSRKRFS